MPSITLALLMPFAPVGLAFAVVWLMIRLAKEPEGVEAGPGEARLPDVACCRSCSEARSRGPPGRRGRPTPGWPAPWRESAKPPA